MKKEKTKTNNDKKLHTIYTEILHFYKCKNKYIIVDFLQIKVFKMKWIGAIGTTFFGTVFWKVSLVSSLKKKGNEINQKNNDRFYTQFGQKTTLFYNTEE